MGALAFSRPSSVAKKLDMTEHTQSIRPSIHPSIYPSTHQSVKGDCCAYSSLRSLASSPPLLEASASKHFLATWALLPGPVLSILLRCHGAFLSRSSQLCPGTSDRVAHPPTIRPALVPQDCSPPPGMGTHSALWVRSSHPHHTSHHCSLPR